jgi:aminopeptidase N
MSTYLLAIVVSDFKRISKVSPKYNVEIEVLARAEAIDNDEAVLALDDAAKLIDFYSDYFGIPYPLKKLCRKSRQKQKQKANRFSFRVID